MEGSYEVNNRMRLKAKILLELFDKEKRKMGIVRDEKNKQLYAIFFTDNKLEEMKEQYGDRLEEVF